MKSHTNLYLFLTIIIFTSRFNLIQDNKYSNLLLSEIGIIETIQIMILGLIIYKLLFEEKLIKKIYKKFYYLKLSIITLILYEEISFLTTGIKILKMSFFNNQEEINIHNLDIYLDQIVPYIDIPPNISLINSVIALLTLIFSFGSYFPLKKNILYLLIDKKYSFLFSIYSFNLIIYNLHSIINFLPYGLPILNFELSELFAYVILLYDCNYKIMQNNKIN